MYGTLVSPVCLLIFGNIGALYPTPLCVSSFFYFINLSLLQNRTIPPLDFKQSTNAYPLLLHFFLQDEVVFSEYESGEQVKLLDSFLAMQQMNLMTVLVVFSTCDSYLELSDESKACIQSPLATIVNESIGVYEKVVKRK